MATYKMGGSYRRAAKNWTLCQTTSSQSRQVAMRLASSRFKVQIGRPVPGTLYGPGPVNCELYTANVDAKFNRVIYGNPCILETAVSIDCNGQTSLVVNIFINSNKQPIRMWDPATTDHRLASSRVYSTRSSTSRRH